MGSYGELTPAQREQVDAFINNISAALYWPGRDDKYAQDYVREHASNLVLTCVFFEKQPPIKKRTVHRRGYQDPLKERSR